MQGPTRGPSACCRISVLAPLRKQLQAWAWSEAGLSRIQGGLDASSHLQAHHWSSSCCRACLSSGSVLGSQSSAGLGLGRQAAVRSPRNEIGTGAVVSISFKSPQSESGPLIVMRSRPSNGIGRALHPRVFLWTLVWGHTLLKYEPLCSSWSTMVLRWGSLGCRIGGLYQGTIGSA